LKNTGTMSAAPIGGQFSFVILRVLGGNQLSSTPKDTRVHEARQCDCHFASLKISVRWLSPLPCGERQSGSYLMHIVVGQRAGTSQGARKYPIHLFERLALGLV